MNQYLRAALIGAGLLLALSIEGFAQDTLTVNRGGTITIRVGQDGTPLPPDTVFIPGDTVFVSDTVVVEVPILLPPDTVIVEVPSPPDTVTLPGDTVTIVVIDTIYVAEKDTVYACPPDWFCEAPDEPGPEPMLRVENVPRATGSQDPDVFIAHRPEFETTQTIVIDFELASKSARAGIFSKDHSGFGTSGHLTVYVENDSLHVRHQDLTSNYLLAIPIALGTSRMTYTFGPDGRRLRVRTSEATDPNPLTLNGNTESIGVGLISWDDLAGTDNERADGNVPPLLAIDGRVSLIQLYDAVITDAEADAIPPAPFDTGGGSPPDTVPAPPDGPLPDFPPVELLARSGTMRVGNATAMRTAYDTTKSFFLVYSQRTFEAETLVTYVDGVEVDRRAPELGIFPAVVTQTSGSSMDAYLPPPSVDPFDIPPHNPMTSMSGWTLCHSTADCGITVALQRDFYREAPCSDPFYNVDLSLFCDFSSNTSDLFDGTFPADGLPHVIRVEALVGNTVLAFYSIELSS